MATVQLSDIIDVTVFQDLPAVMEPTKTAFYESGIVVSNPLLDNLANQPGKVSELPFWNDLDSSDNPNVSSDDPTSSATPKKVTQGEQIGRKAMLNQGWSASDLATELAMGPRAMEHIRSRVDRYWTRQWQKRLVASVVGVYADNVANDSGDMVADVSGATNGDIASGTVFTRENFTSAAFTLGDMVDELSAIAVHSTVYKRMVDNDDIDFIPDSQGRMTIPTYLGHRVIVDDGLPYTPAGGSSDSDSAPLYTSVLFGSGAFGYGDGAPTVPVEVDREPAQGDGGGIETLWTRKTWLLHPFGFAVDATPSADSFTIAELEAAATWNRVVERKNVPMAFLVTNG